VAPIRLHARHRSILRAFEDGEITVEPFGRVKEGLFATTNHDRSQCKQTTQQGVNGGLWNIYERAIIDFNEISRAPAMRIAAIRHKPNAINLVDTSTV
jgi:hypothetical protein